MKSKKYLIIFTGIILFTAIFFGYYLSVRLPRPDFSGKRHLRIVTTLFPIYDFARIIGSDKVDVILLLPPGVEPHTFEPKPRDVVLINQADIFIYSGKYLEIWVDDIIKGVNNKQLLVVDTSLGINLNTNQSEKLDIHSGLIDPHYWLNFDYASQMIDSIASALSKKDPVNNGYYKDNAEKLKKSLSDLDYRYKLSLITCNTKEIIYAGHYAIGYLAGRYGLKYTAAMGVSPDAEPTANELTALVKQIRSANAKFIFYEELSSPKIAETLSSETQTKMLLLNAGHNVTLDQLRQGISFLTIMENNLTNLKTGLGCP